MMGERGRRQRYDHRGASSPPIMSHRSDSMEEPLLTQRRASVSGFLLTLFLAFAIFAISVGSAKYFFPRRGVRQQQVALAVDGPDGPGSGDSNGYTTAQCTGDLFLPVMMGADLVAYFSLDDGQGAMFGSSEYQAVYGGYKFVFVSEQNKALFEADPLHYIPAWGGFCAWGISNEDWWTSDTLGPDADPNSWLISDDGVLYFFRSETPRTKFRGDVSGNVELGNAVWDSWWGDVLPGASGTGSPLDTSCFCTVSSCGDG